MSEKPPAGYAALVLKASLKTHLQGYYLLEPKSSPHGQPTFTFVVNIDGKGQTYEVQGRIKEGPACDDQGHKLSTAGIGMDYALEKKYRLPAGPHRIFLGIPGEKYFKEVKVTLTEGESYELAFTPHYRRYKWGREAFKKGFSGYSTSLHKM